MPSAGIAVQMKCSLCEEGCSYQQTPSSSGGDAAARSASGVSVESSELAAGSFNGSGPLGTAVSSAGVTASNVGGSVGAADSAVGSAIGWVTNAFDAVGVVINGVNGGWDETSAQAEPCPAACEPEAPVYLGRLAVLTTLYSLCEGVVTHPYELVKTRLQVSAGRSPHSALHTLSTVEYLRYLFRRGGLRELYRGFGWNVVGGVPSEVVYYAGYTQAKMMLMATPLGTMSPSAVFVAAGAIADALSVLVSVPTDVISQRLQVQGLEPATPQQSAAQGAAQSTVHSHACRAVDNAATQARSAASQRAEMAASAHTAHPAPLPHTSPTFTASATASATVAPAPSSSTCTASSAERSGFDIARAIVRTEGVRGLWRGVGPTLLYFGPNSAVWWLTHETAKSSIGQRAKCAADHPAVLTLSGALAGLNATLATNPLDVVKTRMQCAEAPTSAMRVVRGVMREAGWSGFYAGVIPRLWAAVPRSIFAVLAYEQSVALCRVSNTRDASEQG